jgi:hypothetical protein
VRVIVQPISTHKRATGLGQTGRKGTAFVPWESARVYRFPSINTSIVANIPFRSWWRMGARFRHFASNISHGFVADLLGYPLRIVFDC